VLIFDSTLRKLQVVLAGAHASAASPWVVHYVDISQSTWDVSAAASANGVTNGATPVDVTAVPGGTTSRQVKTLTLYNADTAAIVPSILYNDNGTTRIMWKGTLPIGYSLLYVDGEGFKVLDDSGAIVMTAPNYTGRQIRATQVLTTGTSYTTPAGCRSIYVELIAGGGGGGGAQFATPNMAFGGGGAAGAFASKSFTVSPSTAYTYAIGGAGAAGANTGGTGGTGGDTTFAVAGVTVTAKGGLGGVGQTGAATLAVVLGGAGVISTNGDVNSGGDPGKNAVRLSGILGGSGQGGSCVYGGGGAGRITNGAGIAGFGYGSGGGGAAAVSANVAGAAGTAGVILVWEFY